MKLYEYEGKEMFRRYGIETPNMYSLINKDSDHLKLDAPLVLKAQVRSGNRKQGGGIIIADTKNEIVEGVSKLFSLKMGGEQVENILAEEKINSTAEYFLSFSYDTDTKGPVLCISPKGGSKTVKATIIPINIIDGISDKFLREILFKANFNDSEFSGLKPVVLALWKLFIDEYALLAEINPLFKREDGKFIAGDAKVIIDDEKTGFAPHRLVEMQGDVAVLASGGGASMLNIDILLANGGIPADYTEYSGNPKMEKVRDLTLQVLNKKGLNGCWVIGGTANFTDIYETMQGFVAGLRSLKEKPKYPIVIRRDGPRQEEAFKMLSQVQKDEGYDFHLFDSKTSMTESAKILVSLMRDKNKK